MSEIKQRNSSVEFLKVFGMFIIVLSHVTLTMNGLTNELSKEALFHVSNATDDLNSIILRVFAYGGYVGNAIFFTCSSWFLCDRKHLNKEKIRQMIIDIWFISVIITLIYILSSQQISFSYIIRSFFPNTLSNNWYTTCYLLFYGFVPLLNKALDATERKQYERMIVTLFLIYFCIGFVLPKNFETNYLVMFIVIHIIIFYIRKFREDLYNNVKLNKVILLVSTLCLLLLILALNFVGLNIQMLNSKMMWFANFQNPFIIAIALSSLMISLNNNFHNKIINTVSGVSLFIYIIHENPVFAAYTRTKIGAYLLSIFGAENVIVISIMFAFVLFIVVTLIAYIYQKTIMKFTAKISSLVSSLYDKFTDKLINIINN